jgi:ABC-2 type transport system permease protein
MREFWSLLRWGLWQRRWFLLWWCIAIAALIMINLAFYPTFRDQAAQLNQSLENIPDSAKALTTDTGEFASPVGFLSSQVYYLMLPMVLGIMSITLGSSLLAREEKEGTIELLLSRPVSRGRLIAAKAIVGTTICFVATTVGSAVTIVMAHLVRLTVPDKHILVASLACFLLALTFGTIAYFITMLGKARIASIGIATLVALGGYIVSSLAGLATWLKTVSKIFPFYYYKPGDMLFGIYHWSNLVVLGSVISVCAVLSWVAFRRRDIAS